MARLPVTARRKAAVRPTATLGRVPTVRRMARLSCAMPARSTTLARPMPTARRAAADRWTALVRRAITARWTPGARRMVLVRQAIMSDWTARAHLTTPRRPQFTGAPPAAHRLIPVPRQTTGPRRGSGSRPVLSRRRVTGGPARPRRRAASPTWPVRGRCPLTSPKSSRIRPPARQKTRLPPTTTPGLRPVPRPTTPGLRPANGDRAADRLRGAGARGGRKHSAGPRHVLRRYRRLPGPEGPAPGRPGYGALGRRRGLVAGDPRRRFVPDWS